ncbi:MAG: polymer-forming cytoskeletal protein [Burkholderiales bacterium]|nr:polymer-forming cytoskeletal protein [Burkholderiales bacterium]
MFDRKHKHAPPQKRIDCLIGAGTTVHGDVTFSGGLRVDGIVRGNVATAEGEAGTLVVSEQARIDGEIQVSHVVVNGTVNGPIVANDFLELQAKAKVVGDIRYRSLEMHLGAVVQGKLDHGEPAAASVVELKRAVADK